ncbi:MAG TPA: HPr family phosphocarrier protein [Candidatus Scatomonas pullistercoris]|uniref:HPr family phosphocarrier protein n=1 Tax=Candidatus Scatomonas pullistercoris TaxID=2840920 RepID=A0A9D1P311_9FIRM|nr:HPr family phosphocarrier protein [Candidatus Scatomonas pullistercoris]
MPETKVMFHDAEEVEEFVNAASRCDFDIDIFYNRIVIDAKSILGILSMGLCRALTVQCYGDSPEFNQTLQKFAVA